MYTLLLLSNVYISPNGCSKVRFLAGEQVSTTKLLTIKDNIMASVFGYARVKKVITLAEDLHVHVVHDEETNEKSLVKCKEKLPIETRLYWEHFLRENKICWMVVPDESHPCLWCRLNLHSIRTGV